MSYTPEIKKGLIDILMFSLYADEKTIYREYVQNALDAINKAVALGVLDAPKDGLVKININKACNLISIKDNGCGIKQSEAVRVLLDISSSEKNGINQAGQFGIGRLVGGGYCHKLTFKTSFKGENKYTKIVFDVDKIWDMVRVDTADYAATTVIEKGTQILFGEENESEHYFEVILENIKESAPSLLSVESVIEYLSETAPIEYKVPFETIMSDSYQNLPEFKEKHTNLDKVQLFVNKIRVQKQYGLNIVGTGDEISQLEYFKIEDTAYGELGWGWFALTKFSIQIPDSDKLACIRLRKHNIQIGNRNLLSSWWGEPRGSYYFYGEFFVTHPNIMPNTARDGLQPNAETKVLEEKLRAYFKFLKSLYSKANNAKNSIAKIKEGLERMKKFGINETKANDLIDNNGKDKFEGLRKNISFKPIERMIELYEPAYREAVSSVEAYKREVTSSENEKKSFSNNPTTTTLPKPEPGSQNGESDNSKSSTKIEPINIQKPSNTQGQPQNKNNGDSDGCNIGTELPPVQGVGENPPQPYTPTPTIPTTAEIIEPLTRILDPSELFIIRRVFNVLNMNCPKNEHDLKLIAQLQKLIVKEFENN